MRLEKLYISHANALNIPICFSSAQKTIESRALIDSGATGNFIDFRTAMKWCLTTTRPANPWQVFDVDGTEN
jgi:hypothetical protein